MKRIFFSYNFKDSKIVHEFYDILKNARDCEVYSFLHVKHLIKWDEAIENVLPQTDFLCLFLGEELGETQHQELTFYLENSISGAFFVIRLPNYKSEIDPIRTRLALSEKKPNSIIIFNPDKEDETFKKIQELCNQTNLDLRLDFGDDLPNNPHLFDYEKTIIDFYINKGYLNNQNVDSDDLDDFLKSFLDLEDYNNIKERSDFDKKVKVGEYINNKIENGCPLEWPEVKFRETTEIENTLQDIGAFRPHDASVIVAALSKYHDKLNCSYKQNFFSFPEAGPREQLYFPKYTQIGKTNLFRVAILISGGIAPGINAVIDGITQRHFKYFNDLHGSRINNKKLEIWGLKNGFKAFSDLNSQHILLFDKPYDTGFGRNDLCTADFINEGGSIIGTSRDKSLLDSERTKTLAGIINQLKYNKIRILYIIGGDGSMKAAHALSHIAESVKDKNWDLSVVGIPKTMDNDILWVWQTFGFLSAVEKAREFIEILNTEVSSNPRLGIVQLFGSDSGFVVSHTVLASKTGVCDIALIPEEKFSIEKLLEEVDKIKNRKGHGLIVMSETAIPTDAIRFADESRDDYYPILNDVEKGIIREFVKNRDNKKHIEGQTADELRSAGLKIVARCIKDKYRDTFRVLINEPRHILRAIPPSTSDIIFGSRLGTLAVDNTMAGYHDFMISQWLTEFVLVPLKLVILGRKRIPNNGIFWKSVLAKTGQAPNMVI